ncbi:hypothetical protein GOP47_0019654 [Adiantum capillus-veneris]|uniref:SHSP domain-containing protein n=1 Tax=Adiantum capillus-veneris TaxID=13818 RepID=A0A9D4Z801_ADICA|nr:hypothetical protein GOP47_0019654 [Adiantum capillus-veneris]
MASPYSQQTHTLNILPQPHRLTHVPHVSKEDTPNACVFTTNISGYKVEDVQVQVEDDEYLVLRFGHAARKFDLPPNACLQKIEATCNTDILTITIPKRAMAA